MLSPDTLRAIELLASELKDRFEPPEYIPGCEVKDVDDKDQYAENNGWIEAVVSKHNRQRCRWKGQFANIETGCFVDVLFYPSYRVYTVSGQSGSGNLSVPASASGTRYDNTSSSLSASTVQQAIDLLATEVAFEEKYNAKGDLIVASADNNASPLGVGSDGYILTADSACTLGVAWKVNAGASGVNFEEKYNAKGDLLIGAADNSASRLPVGASGYVLTADSACDLGMGWKAASGGGGSNPQPAQWISAASENKTGTTYAAYTNSAEGTFEAPATGKVYITVSGRLIQSFNGAYAYTAWELRSGSTIGSGTEVIAADDNRAIRAGNVANTGGAYYGQASHRYLVTGLTSGDTYNIRTMHRSSNTATSEFRSILVEPVL